MYTIHFSSALNLVDYDDNVDDVMPGTWAADGIALVLVNCFLVQLDYIRFKSEL